MTTLEIIGLTSLIVLGFIILAVSMYIIIYFLFGKKEKQSKSNTIDYSDIAIHCFYREDFRDKKRFEGLCEDFGYPKTVDRINIPINISTLKARKERQDFVRKNYGEEI